MLAASEVLPNPLMVIPFGMLLALIALAPLFFFHWWEKHYPKVAVSLGAVTLTYYLFVLQDYTKVMHTFHEYTSFICLIGSLFVVSGGILVRIKGESTPTANVIFLLFGAVIANVLGTTGASMLLIRPWIRMNKYRITGFHIVFFIIVVSNFGGCLTPIGDPPLFLGFLVGVPFWWVLANCWPMWLVGVLLLLAIFYVLDVRNYRRAPQGVRDKLAEPADEWQISGLSNLWFLLIILVAVFISEPLFLREGIMIAAALGSWYLTKPQIHQSNHFNFEPIREVAILFLGIFATMMPALALVEQGAKQHELTTSFFYWSTGLLSGVLDNAPTYLCFFFANFGAFAGNEIIVEVKALLESGGEGLESLAGPNADLIRNLYLELRGLGTAVSESQIKHTAIAHMLDNSAVFNRQLIAISVSAVFFGASTYIGNGPNFMVRTIALQQKIHMPSFLGYVWKYTLPIILPVVFVVWLIFFL